MNIIEKEGTIFGALGLKVEHFEFGGPLYFSPDGSRLIYNLEAVLQGPEGYELTEVGKEYRIVKPNGEYRLEPRDEDQHKIPTPYRGSLLGIVSTELALQGEGSLWSRINSELMKVASNDVDGGWDDSLNSVYPVVGQNPAELLEIYETLRKNSCGCHDSPEW